ncbi:MAG: hypothetical protein Q7U54_14195 [Bacteroidales bacterium]|nr:hypothetical protein [Bacteroidales bacterium]
MRTSFKHREMYIGSYTHITLFALIAMLPVRAREAIGIRESILMKSKVSGYLAVFMKSERTGIQS